MQTRRKFLRSSIITTSAGLVGKNVFVGTDTSLNPRLNDPIVISTWDFGKAANAAAWEVLYKNGTALDAVETGVRVPEADPSNQSVGYGVWRVCRIAMVM